MPDSRNFPDWDQSCVFCGAVPTDHYGLGVIDGRPVRGWVCQACPVHWYGQDGGESDPDPAVFKLTPTGPGAGGTYLLLARR